MCSVHGAECIGNEDLCHVSQSLSKLGVVLGLALVEAQVLKQHDLAGLEGCGLCLCILADGVGRKDDFHAEQFAQALCNGSEGQLLEGLLPRFLSKGSRILALLGLLFHEGFESGVGLAEVGAGDDCRAVFEQVLYGGESGNDTLVAGDLTGRLVLRHVEIAAEQDLLALDINIIDGLLVVVHGTSS